jgi:hypothetical protein
LSRGLLDHLVFRAEVLTPRFELGFVSIFDQLTHEVSLLFWMLFKRHEVAEESFGERA